MPTTLSGSAVALILYDVGEEIDLDQVRQASGARPVEGVSKHSPPEYVGFRRAPVIQDTGDLRLSSGERLRTRMKFYDYGVVSLLFETAFSGEWGQWIELASRWMASTEFERLAHQLVSQQIRSPGSAVVKAYPQWLWGNY